MLSHGTAMSAESVASFLQYWPKGSRRECQTANSLTMWRLRPPLGPSPVELDDSGDELPVHKRQRRESAHSAAGFCSTVLAACLNP